MEVLLVFIITLNVLIGWGIYLIAEAHYREDTKSPANPIQIIKTFLHHKPDLARSIVSSLISGSILTFVSIRILLSDQPISVLEKLLLITIQNLIISALLYLANFDLLSFEIPERFALSIIGILILINTIAIAVLGTQNAITIPLDFEFFPLSNYLGAIIYAGLIGAVVFATKEQGMGAGDIRVAAIIGLSLGLEKSIIALYVSIITAALYGVFFAIAKKKLQGVKLPFVPFMVFGALTTYLLSLGLPEYLKAFLVWF